MACAGNPTNAAALLLSTTAGTGTYTRTGSTLTLRFLDGMTAVLSVKALA
jgi:hypothetical protein